MAFGNTIIDQLLEHERSCIEQAVPMLEDKAAGTGDIATVAAVSIAISMKRIADQIEGVQQLGLVDGIMTAIEQGIINATRR